LLSRTASEAESPLAVLLLEVTIVTMTMATVTIVTMIRRQSDESKKYFPSEGERRLIRDLYAGTTLGPAKIMVRLGCKYPLWYIRRLAGEMGCEYDD
jgi:hypothetical protein